MTETVRLNLGCGHDVREGWVNIDHGNPEADLDIDLDALPQLLVFKLGHDTVAHSEGSHVIEHLHNPLPFLQALWDVTKVDGTAVFRCPYGSSDDAWGDPTHVRPIFPESWNAFGQPYYWRADYGYRGDWSLDQLTLFIDEDDFNGADNDEELWQCVRRERNFVIEQVATLRAVKPSREPLRDLQVPTNIRFAPGRRG